MAQFCLLSCAVFRQAAPDILEIYMKSIDAFRIASCETDGAENKTETEAQDHRYQNVECWSTASAVNAMIESQMNAIAALHSQSAVIANAAESAAMRLGSIGRLVYAGAGTSGRIAVQDGAELFPTYGWPRRRIAFLMAGGIEALTESVERAEDDEDAARAEVARLDLQACDVVIGVAASGSTPYTLTVLREAAKAGAMTIAVANNVHSPLAAASEFAVAIVTGSEVIAGSTRMKAGTAQKAVLNTLSTAIMLRRGLVYQGMMVHMQIANEKLANRALEMIMTSAGVTRSRAEECLESTQGRIANAVLLALDATSAKADFLLTKHDGNLHAALREMNCEE